jgi:hypothetical protein
MDRPTAPFPHRRTALLALGMVLWVAVNAWTWPTAMSFGDEVGYVGQARVFMEGRIRPTATDPGIWHTSPTRGLYAKYPLVHPAILASFMSVTPRAAFVIGIAAALALALVAARVLRSWGEDPLWALVMLAQPAIVVVSRTLMADVLISATLVGAHFALRRGRLRAAAALIAATMVLKPTGPLLACLLLAGEGLMSRADLLARRAPAIRRLAWGGAGLLVGGTLVMALNGLANGTPFYGYHERVASVNFGPRFLATAGLAHAKSLLLNPPLLLLGAWPYWRRRDFGPVLVIAGLCGLMSVYYFVDWGRNRADSLVLSQRLILPAVAFLIVGYVSCLQEILRRLPGALRIWAQRLAAAALLILPSVAAYEIGKRHRRWQQPMTDAMNTLANVTRSRGVTEVGVTTNALKYGLMFPGRTVQFPEGGARPPVVLCATKNTSYRITETDFSCSFEGYRRVASSIGVDILVKSEGGERAP